MIVPHERLLVRTASSAVCAIATLDDAETTHRTRWFLTRHLCASRTDLGESFYRRSRRPRVWQQDAILRRIISADEIEWIRHLEVTSGMFALKVAHLIPDIGNDRIALGFDLCPLCSLEFLHRGQTVPRS